jgi:hypothetical protein
MRVVTTCVLIASGASLFCCQPADGDGGGASGGGSSGGGAGVAGVSGVAAGIGGGAAGFASDPSVGFDASVMPLVDEACRCHQTEPVLMAPFSLKHAEAYDALVGVASIDIPSMVRVAPGSLNGSYLWHKVAGTHIEVMGKGTIMPPGVPLNQEERDVFGRWIAAGAPR